MLPNKLSKRLPLMYWTLPTAIALFAAVYQIGAARYVHEIFGAWAHYGMEVFLYGAMAPIVMWFALGIMRTWVEQKEQAEAEVYRLNIELQLVFTIRPFSYLFSTSFEPETCYTESRGTA